jgi:hypothetical protein
VELARTALVIMLGAAELVLLGIEFLWRHHL